MTISILALKGKLNGKILLLRFFFCRVYITKLLRLVLLPCYRMMKSGTFSKRSGAATKGFESCEFWFQVAFFNLNTALHFLG